MSRVWLVVGVIVSLLVPGTFVLGAIGAALGAGGTTYDYGSTAQTGHTQSYPADDEAAESLIEAYEEQTAIDALKKGLNALVRLNRSDRWGSRESASARRTARRLRWAATMLMDAPDLRRIALKGAAFALALDRFGRHPTSAACYERYQRARKALNRAIRMAQGD